MESNKYNYQILEYHVPQAENLYERMDNSGEGDLDNLSDRKQVLEAKIEQIRQALDDKRNKLAEADKEYQRVRKALAAATEQLMLNAEKEVFDDTVLQDFSRTARTSSPVPCCS